MNNCHKELTDSLIGEAMLSLINKKLPINEQALLFELNNMRLRELDDARLSALQQTIRYIESINTSKEVVSVSHNSVKGKRKHAAQDHSANVPNKNIH